jgi:hypothetical protein
MPVVNIALNSFGGLPKGATHRALGQNPEHVHTAQRHPEATLRGAQTNYLIIA